MIFVTLGTNDKSFKRLLDAFEKEIELGNIKDKVIVQSGFTKYNSKKMKVIDRSKTFIPRPYKSNNVKFNKMIQRFIDNI